MQSAHRGRWRLSSPSSRRRRGRRAPADPAASPRATWSSRPRAWASTRTGWTLALRTAGRGARNNKLAWRGFYSYNRLTDDWAEFALKNDKPFYFSRVRSYGLGEQ